MSKKHITQALHKQRLLIIYIGPWNLGLLKTAHEMMPQLKQKSLTTCLLNQQRASPLIKIILEKINGKVSRLKMLKLLPLYMLLARISRSASSISVCISYLST